MAKRKIPATCSCLESSFDFCLVAGPLLLRNVILWHIDPFVRGNCDTDSETTSTARERLGKHVPVVTDTCTTIEVLLEMGFSTMICAEGL
jgi:hypothetical protein